MVVGYDARRRSASSPRTRPSPGCGGHPRAPSARPAPTPLLAFAVRHLGAAAGVMVTASHNPPRVQRVQGLLGERRADRPARRRRHRRPESRPRHADGRAGRAARQPRLCSRHGEGVAAAYLDAVIATRPHLPSRRATRAPLRIVYTPLHGVGDASRVAALGRGRVPARVVSVPEQRSPTARSHGRVPEPRGAGRHGPRASPLARRTGRTSSSPTIPTPTASPSRVPIRRPTAATGSSPATSSARSSGTTCSTETAGEPRPDAGPRVHDRLVAAARRASRPPRRPLRGDAHGLQVDRQPRRCEREHEARVSSSATRRRSATASATSCATRTASAARLRSEVAATARSTGASLLDRYDAIETAHGVHLTTQLTLPTHAAASVMARLRTVPPATLGGVPVTSAIDLARGEGNSRPPTFSLTGWKARGWSCARAALSPRSRPTSRLSRTSRTGTSRPLAPMPAIGSARCEALSPPCSALRRFHDRGSFVALVPDSYREIVRGLALTVFDQRYMVPDLRRCH